MDGYIQDFSFEPIYDDTAYKVIKIKIDLHPTDAERKKLLLGDGEEIGDDPKKDNMNVFHTLGKYENDLSWDLSTFALKKIMNVSNQMRNDAKLLVQTGLFNSYENYKEWYETNMEASFERKEFNMLGNSKLKRDIHDYIFMMKEFGGHNDTIREYILKENAKI